MHNAEGEQVWERSLDTFGKVKHGDNNSCPFMYQGQYYDAEIDLAYNRFRYYDPEDGRYISVDTIGLLSHEFNFYDFVANTNLEVDLFGLSSTILNSALGGVTGDNMQAHHLIPEKTWGNNSSFLNEVGLSGQRDSATNGLLMHDTEIGAINNDKAYYHRGRHDEYSKMVDKRVKAIEKSYAKHGDKNRAKSEIRDLQKRLGLH